MKRSTIIATCLGALICLAVVLFSPNDDMIIESSSQVFMSSPDKSGIMGNAQLVRSGDEEQIIASHEPDEPNILWNSKEYTENWCFTQELNESGQATLSRLQNDYNLTRGYPEDGSLLVTSPPTPTITGYESYEIDVLKKLGIAGDLIALWTLAHHPEASETDKQWAAYESFVLGGSALLYFHVISVTHDASMALIGTNDAETIAASKEKYLNGIAWGQFSALRGDFHGLTTASDILKNLHTMPWLKAKLSLTEEDIASTEQIANQFLLEINNERRRRGMSDLVNDAPKHLESMFNDYYARLLANGENSSWAASMPPGESRCFDQMVEFYTSLKAQ